MKDHASPVSLVRRLFQSMFIATLATAAILLATVFALIRHQGNVDLERRADEYIASLTKTLEIPIWGYDDDTVVGAVEAYSVNDHIAFIRVTGSNGSVLAEIIKPGEEAAIQRKVAIYHHGLLAGHVELALTSSSMLKAVVRIVTSSALVLFFTFLISFLAASYLLKKQIKKPLEEMSGVVRAYAKGDYSIPLMTGYLEFQDFFAVLGDMADTIRLNMEELEQAEKKYRALVESTEDLITWVDESGTFLFVNPASRTYFGLPPEECLGKSAFDFIHPDDREHTIRSFTTWMNTNKDFFHFENRQVSRTGDVHTLLWTANKLFDREGNVKGFSSIGRNITRRKRIEEELTQLRNYLSNIIDSMPSVLVGVDRHGRVTQWNTEACRRTGISSEKAMGQPLDTVFPKLAVEMDRVRESMSTRKVSPSPRKTSMEGGEVLYEDVTVYPLVANGVEGAVIRVDDVTEQVRLEQLMIQSEKMLSVGGLAAGMAHEINNPLAAIIGYTQNINKRLFSDLPRNLAVAEECSTSLDVIQDYLNRRDIPSMLSGIMESGKRAATIVSNMLGFSRKSDHVFSSHSLEELLEGTLELAASDYDLKKQHDFRKIELVRDYDPDLPTVLCDSNEIQQVLLNLIRNGAEAMAEKQYGDGNKPRLTFSLKRRDDMAVIKVEDNGPGMDEQTRNRIFEPFFTTKPVGQGTGLGLSVSYFIITDLHRGSMSVRSVPGEWTRFTMQLPLFHREDGS